MELTPRQACVELQPQTLFEFEVEHLNYHFKSEFGI